MGWFLTKSKPAKKKPTTKQPTAKSWDPSSTLRLLKLTGWAVFISALAGGWWMGEKHLRKAVAAQTSALPQVELVDVPAHVQQWLIDDMRRTVAAVVDPNPFEQLSLQEVAFELERHPWVRRVDRVVRKPNGVISIEAVYRKPGGLIAAKDGFHLIDNAGVLLIEQTYDEAEARRLDLPIFVGVRRGGPARAGTKWNGNDVQAGLMLAALVERQEWRDQVVAIDVSNFDGRITSSKPHLNLMTARAHVGWGRAPGSEGVSEPKAAKKLANLESAVRSRFGGTIDAHGRGVDLAPLDVPIIYDAVRE